MAVVQAAPDAMRMDKAYLATARPPLAAALPPTFECIETPENLN
jgi:hypothetical protein